jgi:hypothetical protein
MPAATIEAISRDKRFLESRWHPAPRVNPLIESFDPLNVLSTYCALAKERGIPRHVDQEAAA